ncbi:hypothetical protein [Candidatus Electronema sp. JC]
MSLINHHYRQIGAEVKTAARNGKAVQLTVPAAGCSIWKAV